jgi:hypothetical protein
MDLRKELAEWRRLKTQVQGHKAAAQGRVWRRVKVAPATTKVAILSATEGRAAEKSALPSLRAVMLGECRYLLTFLGGCSWIFMMLAVLWRMIDSEAMKSPMLTKAFEVALLVFCVSALGWILDKFDI